MKRETPAIVEFEILKTTLTSFSFLSGGGSGGGCVGKEKGGLVVVCGGGRGSWMSDLVLVKARE